MAGPQAPHNLEQRVPDGAASALCSSFPLSERSPLSRPLGAAAVGSILGSEHGGLGRIGSAWSDLGDPESASACSQGWAVE